MLLDLPSHRCFCVLGTIPGLHHFRSKFWYYQSDKPATSHHQMILSKEHYHSLLPRNSGVLPSAFQCPEAGPHHSTPRTLHPGPAHTPLCSHLPPAPQTQAFPLRSFIRHSAKGTSISIRDFLPRNRTRFKWSKEI